MSYGGADQSQGLQPNLYETSNSELPQSSDLDSSQIFNDREHRLSPNLFLNLNFDHNALVDANAMVPSNGLTFEWNTATASLQPHPSSIILGTGMGSVGGDGGGGDGVEEDSQTPPYDDIRYLNVDHFSILNLDQSILGPSSCTPNELTLADSNEKISQCLDMQFGADGGELLDLEKPININVNMDSLNDDKF